MKKIYFILSSLLIFSCSKNFEENAPIKPNPSGKSGEIIVVIPDKQWQSTIGDTIFYTLTEPFGVLPQDESYFDVVHLPLNSFQSIFKTHRNIIFIDINPKNIEAKISKQKNKWASFQLIYYIYAPDEKSFYDLWNKSKNQIIDDFYNEEILRYQKAYAGSLNKEVISKISNKYHVSIMIPQGYYLDVEKEHFAWISRETEISSQGIFIYDYPYTDPKTFTVDYILQKRDDITKIYVPGPNPNTYMQTERRVPVEIKEINLNGEYAILIRGLWYTKNYFLGGPFVSITTLDKKRNQVVTVEAYVYAGKQRKKLYIWQEESIIKTLKILN